MAVIYVFKHNVNRISQGNTAIKAINRIHVVTNTA